MAGKIAQGTSIVGTGKDALAAFVNMGDTSVPGIEPSDLNDGDILARTRENVNPNGQFQFIYIPEDGSENIVSDWISQEHKKKVTLSWVEGVKAAIIGRAQEGLRAANEKAAEERLKKIQQEQMEDVGDNTRHLAEVSVSIPTKSGRAENVGRSSRLAQTVSSDPSEYVKEQLGQAAERLKAAEELLREYTKEVFLAKKDHAKWQALSVALGTNTESDSEPMANIQVSRPVSDSNGNVSIHKSILLSTK